MSLKIGDVVTIRGVEGTYTIINVEGAVYILSGRPSERFCESALELLMPMEEESVYFLECLKPYNCPLLREALETSKEDLEKMELTKSELIMVAGFASIIDLLTGTIDVRTEE